MIWCRLEMETKYYYVLTTKEFAMVLCIKQGYEINCEPPPNNREGYHEKKRL